MARINDVTFDSRRPASIARFWVAEGDEFCLSRRTTG
jgi:hypothetical protein